MTAPESRGPKSKKRRRDRPGPALQSLTLNPDTIPADQTGTFAVSYEVGLDGPAPPGGVQVEIVDGPSVFVTEGQTTGSQTFTPTTRPAGEYPVEARLGEVTKTAILRVVPGPTLVSFTLTPETLAVTDPLGAIPFDTTGAVVFEVGLDGPAPPGGVQVEIFLVGTRRLTLPVPEPPRRKLVDDGAAVTEFAEGLKPVESVVPEDQKPVESVVPEDQKPVESVVPEDQKPVESVLVAEGETTSSTHSVRVRGKGWAEYEYEARLGTVSKAAVLHVR